MKLTSKHWLPLVGCVMLVVGLISGWLIGRRPAPSPALEKLYTVFSLIDREYVDDVDLDSLLELTLPELLQNLDPHSLYISAADREMVNSDLESSFFGVGLSIRKLDDTLHVAEVIPGGPADRVGILAGDRIIEVDGTNIVGPDFTTEDAVKMLRGERDTKVKVTVKRLDSKKPIQFEITRGLVPSKSIDASYMLNDSIGYIKVGRFARETYSEFLTSLMQLSLEGATTFMIDLRGNTGGFLEPAVLMVNEFLSPGQLIVSTKGRNEAENQSLYSDGTGTFHNSRLVVLIDQFSASASEIFAGAIQDNDRGMVLGLRSFGKGLVQHNIMLPDSSELRLTVQRYYTPSGRCIQKLYTPGRNDDYKNELLDRYAHGETFSVDSIRLDSVANYTTLRGRTVYGGGGIVPDVFVPTDTTGYTSYYIKLRNAGLLIKYADEYVDLNRSKLEGLTLPELLKALPPNNTLLSSFVTYAVQKGIPYQPYYLNNSRSLIVKELIAYIVRDVLGQEAFYEFINTDDAVIDEALRQIEAGNVEQITMFNDPA